jgi:hypothetical protein
MRVRRSFTPAVMKGTAAGSSQRADEAGGNPIQGTLVRVASSPDKDGTGRHCQTARVRQASWEGVRKKPVSERSLRENHQLQPGGCGLGRGAHPHFVGGTPWSVDVAGREATPKVCGVGVARSQGHNWAPHPTTSNQEGDVGTGPLVPQPAMVVGGNARRQRMLVARGGGPVVVRAGESPVPGEGVQRVGSIQAKREGRR